MKFLEKLRNRQLCKIKWRLEIFENGNTNLNTSDPESIKALKRICNFDDLIKRIMLSPILCSGSIDINDTCRASITFFGKNRCVITTGSKQNLVKLVKKLGLDVNYSELDGLIKRRFNEYTELQTLKSELE